MNSTYIQETAPFFGLSRLRIGRDGPGVTTLAAFCGCPLKCCYCLNPLCHETGGKHCVHLSPQELYDRIKIDNLYFRATGGGVTFGGGEPGMYSAFIARFRALCGPRWKLNVETSLYLPPECLEELATVTDLFIVDVKDLNPDIYRRYTGADVTPVIRNLERLHALGRADDTHIRVPHIPGYNTPHDVALTRTRLRELGFGKVEEFTYRTR